MKLIMENWRGYIEEQSSADDFGTNMALIINESEESNQALASVASGVEKAEKETIRAFGDTPEAQRKIMEALEIYLGPAETWFDPKTGKWNEKPLRRMIALEKDLGKTSKAIRRAVQSDMPIEQKMAGLATATKTTAAGSLLTGLYQAWEGREAMLPSFGVKGANWSDILSGKMPSVTVNMGDIPGEIFFEAAFFLAATTIALGVVKSLISAGRETYEALTTSARSLSGLLSAGLKLATDFLGGVKKLAQGSANLVKKYAGKKSKEKPTLPPSQDNVDELNEAIHFIRFCKLLTH